MTAALHSRWNQFRNLHGNRLVRSNSFTLHLSPGVYVGSGRSKSKKNPVTTTKVAAIKTLAFTPVKSPDVTATTSTSATTSSPSAAHSTSEKSTKAPPISDRSTNPASLKSKKSHSVSGRSISNKAPSPPVKSVKTPPIPPRSSKKPSNPINSTNPPPTSVRSTKSSSNSAKPTIIPAPTKSTRNQTMTTKTSHTPAQSTKTCTTKCGKATTSNAAKSSKIPIPSTKSTRAPSIPSNHPRSTSNNTGTSPNTAAPLPPVSQTPNVPPSDDQQQQTVRYIFSKALPARPTSLAAIQKPLLDVYLAHLNRDRSSVPAVVDVLDDGLRVQYAERDGSDIVEMTNQFNTIAYWAAVKCVVRPQTAATNKEIKQNSSTGGVAIGFFPFTENGEYLTKSGGGAISSDSSSDQADELFQWLDDSEQHRSLLDTEHAPLFACIMRRARSTSAALYCHVFLCGNAVQAIQLASDLYRKLNGNLRRQRQHSGTASTNDMTQMSTAPVVTNDVPGGSAWRRSSRLIAQQPSTSASPKAAEPKPSSHGKRHPTTATRCPLHNDQPKRTSSRHSTHSSASHVPKPRSHLHQPRQCHHHHPECRIHQPVVCSQCSRPCEQQRHRRDKSPTGTRRSSSFSQLLLHGLRRLTIKDLCCNTGTSTGTGFRQKIRAHFQQKSSTREHPTPVRQQRRHSDIFAVTTIGECNKFTPKPYQSAQSSTRSDMKRRYRSSQRPPTHQSPASSPRVKNDAPSYFNRSSSIGPTRVPPVHIKFCNSQPRAQRWDRKFNSGDSGSCRSDHVYQSMGSGSGRLDGAPSLSAAKANWVKLLGFIDGAKYQTPHGLRPRSRHDRDGESDPILGRQACATTAKCGLSRRVRVATNATTNASTSHRRQSSALAADIIVPVMRPVPSPRQFQQVTVQSPNGHHQTKMEIKSGTQPETASCIACRRKDRPPPPTSPPPPPPPPPPEQAYAEISEAVVECEKLPTDVPSQSADTTGGAASNGHEVLIQGNHNHIKYHDQPVVKATSLPVVCTIGRDADMDDDDDDFINSDNEFDSLEDDLFFLSRHHRRIKPTSTSAHLSSTLTKAKTHLTGTSQRVFRRFFGTPDATPDNRHRKSLPVVVGVTLSSNRNSPPSVFGCPPSDLLTSEDTALKKKDAEIVSVLEQIFQRAVTAAAVAAAATASDCRVSDVSVGRPPMPSPRLREDSATVEETDDNVSDSQVAIPSSSTNPHWGWATFLP